MGEAVKLLCAHELVRPHAVSASHKIYVAQQNVALPSAISKEKGISLIPIITAASHPEMYADLPKMRSRKLPRHLCHWYLNRLTCTSKVDGVHLMSPAQSQDNLLPNCQCGVDRRLMGTLNLEDQRMVESTEFLPITFTRTCAKASSNQVSISYSVASKINANEVCGLAKEVSDTFERNQKVAIYTPPMSLENSSVTAMEFQSICSLPNNLRRDQSASNSSLNSLSSSASSSATFIGQATTVTPQLKPVLPTKRQPTKSCNSAAGKRQKEMKLSARKLVSSLKIITELAVVKAPPTCVPNSASSTNLVSPPVSSANGNSQRSICKDTATALAGLEMLFSGGSYTASEIRSAPIKQRKIALPRINSSRTKLTEAAPLSIPNTSAQSPRSAVSIPPPPFITTNSLMEQASLPTPLSQP